MATVDASKDVRVLQTVKENHYVLAASCGTKLNGDQGDLELEILLGLEMKQLVRRAWGGDMNEQGFRYI